MDAIYLLCFTKSYFTNTHAPLILHQENGFRVEGEFEHNGDTTHICQVLKQGKKEIFRDQVLYEKISDHIGSFNAVMIAPDDLELINGGAEFRRKWLDGLLSQTSKTYFENLVSYQQILQRRNAWLKMQKGFWPKDLTVLDFFDQKLVESGKVLIQNRAAFLSENENVFQQHYRQICKEKEQCVWRYKCAVPYPDFAEILFQNRTADLRAERTSVGPHRDDVELKIGELQAAKYASQGQKKSLLFALKLTQHFYTKTQTRQAPILLLDDVFEKLDEHRLEALFRLVSDSDFGQVFLTDTSRSRFENFWHSNEICQHVELL